MCVCRVVPPSVALGVHFCCPRGTQGKIAVTGDVNLQGDMVAVGGMGVRTLTFTLCLTPGGEGVWPLAPSEVVLLLTSSKD